MKQSDFTMRKKLLSLQPLLKYLLSSILLPLRTSRLKKTKIKNSKPKKKKTSKLLAVIVTRWKRGKEKLSRT